MLPQSAAEHYRSQQRLTVATLAATRKAWQGMGPDFDGSWRSVGPRLLVLLSAAQVAAARAGAESVPATLAELGMRDDPAGEVNPRAFAGVASDGRPLDSLLYGAVTRAKVARTSNSLTVSLDAGRDWLDMAVQTQVADANRGASGVAIASRPDVGGYVRMLNLPSCSRCAVLAGRFYRWNEGFARHPRCDCRHVPAPENVAGDITTDPRKAIEAGKVTGLSAADRKAIVEDGADVSQVINARRGMYNAGGRKFTTEGTTRRGQRAQRIRPEQIYRDAEDRADAIRLLRRHGYLTT